MKVHQEKVLLFFGTERLHNLCHPEESKAIPQLGGHVSTMWWRSQCLPSSGTGICQPHSLQHLATRTAVLSCSVRSPTHRGKRKISAQPFPAQRGSHTLMTAALTLTRHTYYVSDIPRELGISMCASNITLGF